MLTSSRSKRAYRKVNGTKRYESNLGSISVNKGNSCRKLPWAFEYRTVCGSNVLFKVQKDIASAAKPLRSNVLNV